MSKHQLDSVLIEKSDNGLPLLSVFLHGRQKPTRYIVPKAELPKFVQEHFERIVTFNDLVDKLEEEHAPDEEEPEVAVAAKPKEVKRGKRDDAL